MRSYRAIDRRGTIASTLVAVVSLLAFIPHLASAQGTAKTTSFAQQLVEAARIQHPEADEIGVLATTGKGCFGIASTDRSDVGERCEADDMRPMKTGEPSVEREGGGFDVSVLLHDAAGRTVGVLAVGFEKAPGRTEAAVREATKKMEKEMAARIPSKAKLLEGWR